MRHYRDLKPAHLDRFLAKLNMPDLRHLDLSGRPVGATAVRRLTDPKFSSLTRLRLNDCKLTNASVKSLLASSTLCNLIQLDLESNRLNGGVEQLADRAVLPHLASCSLSANLFPAPLARKLRRRAGVRV